MATRREILRAIARYAKENALEVTLTEGSNHTKVTLGTRRTVVGRRAEINENTARAIDNQLGMNR